MADLSNYRTLCAILEKNGFTVGIIPQPDFKTSYKDGSGKGVCVFGCRLKTCVLAGKELRRSWRLVCGQGEPEAGQGYL